jgi:hypothetical protein
MKYSANFFEYKIQPFLAENNSKNPNIYEWQKRLAFFSRFSIKIIYIKINYFARDLPTHVTA